MKYVTEEHINELFTSINVIEELSYVLLKLKTGDKYGIDRHYDLLTFLREKPDVVKVEFSEIAEDIEDLLRLLSVEVLPPAPYREMCGVSMFMVCSQMMHLLLLTANITG